MNNIDQQNGDWDIPTAPHEPRLADGLTPTPPTPPSSEQTPPTPERSDLPPRPTEIPKTPQPERPVNQWSTQPDQPPPAIKPPLPQPSSQPAGPIQISPPAIEKPLKPSLKTTNSAQILAREIRPNSSGQSLFHAVEILSRLKNELNQ
jgi:hypothetical protein